ncbi:MAG: hypothetical protein COS94_08265, partial [Candidatus Hydrogenedentes bacterium CG07_land_8_20_14_0_80_42_17]
NIIHNRPDTIVRAARFVLGTGDKPVLPDLFGSSWTGDLYPNEFFRDQFPMCRRSRDEYIESVMQVSWENMLSQVNESWGYPGSRVSADEIRSWFGPPTDEVRQAFEEKAAAIVSPEAEKDLEWIRFIQPSAHFREIEESGRNAFSLGRVSSAIAEFLRSI